MITNQTANGQSNPEYVTVILRICGIEEKWTTDNNGNWESSIKEIRSELEDLVKLIKERVVENIKAHEGMKESVDFINRWLEYKKKDLI